MAALILDRMAVDDAATTPEKIAAEIHRQLGPIDEPVPVFDIARALDIERIEQRPLSGFEAMLLCGPERDIGYVALNSRSNPRRRRYSLAHELGHFLCAWHKPAQKDGFTCCRGDMSIPSGSELHVRQEREANSFAIELLAPAYRVEPCLKRLPDLEVVLSLHRRLDISKVAAARRYVGLHGQTMAVVVANAGRFLYVERNEAFPYLPFERGDRLPALPGVSSGSPTSEMVDADLADWRLPGIVGDLSCQVLAQEEGYALVLLHLDRDDGGD